MFICDEDAFALTNEKHTQSASGSAADHCVADHHPIDDLLRAFEDGARLRASRMPHAADYRRPVTRV